MSAGVEDRGGRDARSSTSLAPGHPPHRPSRTLRIPTSPVTAVPAEPEPDSADSEPVAGPRARLGPGTPPSAGTPAAPEPSQTGPNPFQPPPRSQPPPQPPIQSQPPIGPLPSGSPQTPPKSGKHHHHVLIEPEEDRWAWRRRIRRNPHQLRLYRVGVGIAGLLLICLGLLTGPLPGPGGIPLVLLGLAIWSSEFEWAYRLRQRFKAEIKRFRGRPTGQQVTFWIVFCALCASFGYSYLLILGVPFWVPDAGASLLEHLPGVEGQR